MASLLPFLTSLTPFFFGIAVALPGLSAVALFPAFSFSTLAFGRDPGAPKKRPKKGNSGAREEGDNGARERRKQGRGVKNLIGDANAVSVQGKEALKTVYKCKLNCKAKHSILIS